MPRKVLHGLARKAEVGGRREHVAIVGPHRTFSDFACRRKMDRVCGTYEEIAGSGDHQHAGPPQQSFVDGNEVPQSTLYVLGEAHGQFARIAGRRCAFTHAAMKHGMELGQGP